MSVNQYISTSVRQILKLNSKYHVFTLYNISNVALTLRCTLRFSDPRSQLKIQKIKTWLVAFRPILVVNFYWLLPRKLNSYFKVPIYTLKVLKKNLQLFFQNSFIFYEKNICPCMLFDILVKDKSPCKQ